jgi:hypothetical protein
MEHPAIFLIQALSVAVSSSWRDKKKLVREGEDERKEFGDILVHGCQGYNRTGVGG